MIGLHLQTNLSNDWAALSASILPVGSDVPIGSLESEVEYYSGRDSEGSWSEGSREGSRFAIAPPPGEYRIEALVQGPPTLQLNMRVSARDRLTRWPLLLAIAMLIPALVIQVRRVSFENQRWGVDEED